MRRFWLGFVFAFRGLRHAAATQRNMRFHIFSLGVVLLAGWWVKLSRLEWALVLSVSAGVFCAEMFNTAVEWLCDHVSPGHNEQVGRIKDVAAAAVLAAALGALATGLLVFGPHIGRLGKMVYHALFAS